MEPSPRGSLAHNNPIDPERLLQTVDLLGLHPGARILDLGCGTGELLLTLGQRGLQGIGIDVDPDAIAQARARAGALPTRFIEGRIGQIELPTALDLVICIGATHALGEGAHALPETLRVARELIQPGGHVLIGEGCRRGPLPEPYRALLGDPTGIERTHLDNVATCEAHAFVCLHALTASVAEWDAFEWAHFRRQRARAEGLPEAERAPALERAARWRDAYLRWGRDTMGFGLYLLEAR